MKKLDLIEDRWLSIKEIAEYLAVYTNLPGQLADVNNAE